MGPSPEGDCACAALSGNPGGKASSPAWSMRKEVLHMGTLTESMTRLCGEIVALRGRA